MTPCREVCVAAMRTCEEDIEELGLYWPTEANCEKLPVAADGNCDHFGEGDFCLN